MALLALIVVILLVATVRYGDDSRDARDWSTPRPLAHSVSSTRHLGALPTPRSDAIRLARFAARAARAVAGRAHRQPAAAPLATGTDTVVGCC